MLSLRQRWKQIICLVAVQIFTSVSSFAASTVVTHVDLDPSKNSPSNKLHQVTYAVRRGVGLSVPLEWKPYLFWHEALPLALLEYESEDRTISLASAAESDLDSVLKYIHIFDGIPAESIPGIQEFLKKRFQIEKNKKNMDRKALSVAENLRLSFEYLFQVDRQLNTNFFIHEVLRDFSRNLKFLSGAGESREYPYWGARIWTQLSMADKQTLFQFFKTSTGMNETLRSLLMKKSTKLEDPLLADITNPILNIYQELSHSILNEGDPIQQMELIRIAAYSFPFVKANVQFYQDQIHALDTHSEDVSSSFLKSEIQTYKQLIQSSLQASLSFIQEMQKAQLGSGLYVFYADQFQQQLKRLDSGRSKISIDFSDTNPWPFVPSLLKDSQAVSHLSCDSLFPKEGK